MEDTFSVHVRGVGQWTNKLYNHFQVNTQPALVARHLKVQEAARGQEAGRGKEAGRGQEAGRGKEVVKGKEVGRKDLEAGSKAGLKRPLEIYVDGPFGSPSSNIYRSATPSVTYGQESPGWISLYKLGTFFFGF